MNQEQTYLKDHFRDGVMEILRNRFS